MIDMKITINNQEYQAKSGQTVLEVARENEIKIPTLCYSEHLSITGACRLCIVEIENGQLVPACATPVSEGMKIETDSEEVYEARKTVIDLLLSDHPLTCMTCEANGDCKLQDLAYEYGLEESSYGIKEAPRFEIQQENPFIVFDPDKCIICGKCVRADQELQCSMAIDFSERGFKTKVAAAFDEGLGGDESSCVFCGLCVENCPTGALKYKPAIRKGRDYDLRKERTTCPYCGVGCQLELQIKDNEVVKVASIYDKDSPNPAGEACVKGRFAYDYINHPDRLRKPLIKKDGEFVEVSWEEALNYTAERLQEIKEKDGPQALAGLSSAKCTNEENYLMQKFMRAVIGTNSVDHCARLCHASTVAGLARAFGSGAMTNSIAETADSDLFFIIGSNPTENHPVIGSMMKRALAKGTKLIVADPREIELSSWADVNIHQQPGSDVALVNAMINVIINEGLHDKEFIKERTINFDLIASTIEDYTPETAEKISGVPAEEIRKAARLYAKADRAAIYFAMGITQHKTGTDNVLALANLAMVTGNVGKKGAGVNPLRGQNNVQGACDLGALPNVYPGYQKVEDPAMQEKFAEAWGIEPDTENGLTVVEIFNEAGKDIKGIYIMGENPVLSDPDQNHIKQALEDLEFLVVQDIFMTETAEYADVVLPAASFAEKSGTFTNTERRIQLVNPAVESPGEAKPDWQIISMLASKMGYAMDYAHPAEIMAEIASLTPIYGGVYHGRLREKTLQWPCPDRRHAGTKFLHEGEFARGKGKFHPVTYLPPAEKVDADYDYIMMTGRMLYHFHTGTMTRRSAAINAQEADAYVEINCKDAKRLGIKENDRVKVTSRRGEVETYARVGDRVQPGQMFMPFHYAESPANRLTNPVLDEKAKIPELKVTAVKLEKIS